MKNLSKDELEVVSYMIEKIYENLLSSDNSEPNNNFFATDDSLLFSANKEDVKMIKKIINKLK